MERECMNRGKGNGKCYCYYFICYEDNKRKDPFYFVIVIHESMVTRRSYLYKFGVWLPQRNQWAYL